MQSLIVTAICHRLFILIFLFFFIFFRLLKFINSIDPGGGGSQDKSNTGDQRSRVRMGCNWEVEMLICCLVSGPVGDVVTAASILGA